MDTMGIAEFKSIGEGARATDFMVKRAGVDVLWAKTICPGKFLTILTGDTQEVKESMEEVWQWEKYLVGSCIISRVHPAIVQALHFRYDKESIKGALGLLESSSVAECIQALDHSLKNADVRLKKMALGMGIGGKAYYIITGEVSAVEMAIEAGKQVMIPKKLLSAIVLPSPDELLLSSLGLITLESNGQ